ncbi:ERI1 exoribonuclease 3 [Nasonia vitripennis]|uniref:Exonuclease domain-containing protein n=1 Tax=Nasonia vitripennis TaxID=7425 RepID=A0A7M7GD69_NASVI|nr:ERI1 exoribonuclease 3 [Nasonia vitripennis]
MAHRALMGLNKNLPNRLNKIKPLQNLLVLDFEATCVKDVILKPQEIIEFPCLVVSTEDWQVKDAFHEYVKPRINPKLSDFCTELTGIMQETLENEEHFPEVFSKFCSWIEDGNYFDEKDKSAFVTCGDWDLKVMLPSQCELDNINVPDYLKEWINLKSSFCLMTKYYPRSLADMLRHLNMKFQGKNHCGIDDVHNMTRVIQKLADKYKAEFTINTKIEEETKDSV